MKTNQKPSKAQAKKIVQYFTAKETAEFAGLTLSMVDYLCRFKIVMPANKRKRGRGIQREYGFGDIVMMKSIAKLLEAGVSVLRLKTALASLRKHHEEISAEGIPAAYLVTNGKDVLFRHKSGVLELLASGQFSFAFVVEVESVRKEAIDFAKRQLVQAEEKSAKKDLACNKAVA